MPSTRKRKIDSAPAAEGAGDDHVYMVGIDDPDRVVEVDVRMLENFNCRLAAVVRHGTPVERGGKLVYRAEMTREMLLTLLKSMRAGELVLCKGVTVGEALATFEYENVVVGGDSPASTIKMPRGGIAFSKRRAPAAEAVTSLCERVADALLHWPRLESLCSHSLGQKGGTHASVSSTRAWVRFADRPKSDGGEGSSFCVTLVVKNSKWFKESLIALGNVWARLVHSDAGIASELAMKRDEEAFRRLITEIENDPLGSFFACRYDAIRSDMDAKTRKWETKAEAFFQMIRNTIIGHAQENGGTSTPSLEVQYARACVTYCENAINTDAILARVFSSAHADEPGGGTPERAALKRALKKRGVGVVRWSDARETGVKPLVFPPTWVDTTSNNSSFGPSVLLDFSSLV